MKTLATIIIAFLTALSATSQPKTTFGIKGGINLITTSSSPGTMTSFSAGAFTDIEFSKDISFQPGIFYSGKGYKTLPSPAMATTRINYLNIPLNLIYKRLAGKGNFFIGAGPFAAIAVSANEKGYGFTNFDSKSMSYYDVKVPIGNNEYLADGRNNNLKRMEYGVTGLAGYHLKNGLLLSVNYDLGLTSIRYSSSLKTRVLGVSLGYTF